MGHPFVSWCMCVFSLYLSFIYVDVFVFEELYLFRIALTRPAFSQVWRDRVLRAYHLTNHQYIHYIQPDLLFRHSFSSEPSSTVLSLIQVNEKSKCLLSLVSIYIYIYICIGSIIFTLVFYFSRLATMKINKNKLKSLVEKGGPIMTTSLKRKKTNEGQSSILPGPPVKKAAVV